MTDDATDGSTDAATDATTDGGTDAAPDGSTDAATDVATDGPTDATDRPRLAGIGAYAPRVRIEAGEFEAAWGRFEASGVDQKAVPDADEDALTMGAEAAARALAAADREGSAIAHLAFATTTPPMAEEDLTPRLANILGAPSDVTTRTLTGSTRAGVQALAAALEAGPWDGEAGIGLVVASDCPRGAPDSETEHAAGAGATAFVLDADGPGEVLATGEFVEPYPGTRFRAAGGDETDTLGVTEYEREAFTTALGGAVDALQGSMVGSSAGPTAGSTAGSTGGTTARSTADALDVDVDAAAVQSPDGDLPYRATDALGVDAGTIAAADTVSDLGDTGAASVPLGAASAIADGAERLLLAAYGSGAGATALLVDASGVPVDAALTGDETLTYAEYLRRRGEITSGEPEGGGAYVSVPSWQRTHPQRHRLVAGRCPDCGALQFPPAGACGRCGALPDAYDTVELPGTGTIEALTSIAQGGAPPEFVEQQARSGPFVSAVVAFDGPEGDESVSAPAQVLTTGAEDPDIGTRVEATVRRIYQQEGVIRYGFKVQPLDAKR